jgi:hypothetical protein
MEILDWAARLREEALAGLPAKPRRARAIADLAPAA